MNQHEARFIADLLPQIVWTASPDGVVDYVNHRLAAYAGDAVKGLGRNWLRLVAADDRRRFWARCREAILAGETFTAECRLRRADGVYRRHWVRGDPLHGADGEILKWFGTSTDIEDQKCANEERLRLAAIVESCDDAILSVTLEGIISSWNGAAERMFGYAAAEVLGRHVSLIAPADRHEEMQQILAAVSRGESVAHHQTTRVRKDGTAIEVSLTVSPIRDQEGRITGISKVLRDVTQEKRGQEELKRAKDAAEEASKAKDRFLAMLSHELRTPLTPVLAAVTGMRLRNHRHGQLREELELIRRNVELEARLIDDLLDLTGIMRGTLQLNRETVDVEAILEAAAKVCAQEIAGKSLELRVQLEAKERYIEGDAARLQQVLWNLIRNAVKFTPEGGKVLIRTRNASREAAGLSGDAENEHGGIVIEVVDTGVGIEAAFLSRMFNAFERARDLNDGRVAGLGMGLAISKALVEMHGGWIQAASDGPGQGAVFTIWLPTTRVAAMEEEKASAKQGVENLRILLVEDHEGSRHVLARLLRSLNHQVTVASDMGSALKATKERRFDLLVSDLNLPDGNGLELMRRIREAGPVRGICLSGLGSEEDMRRSQEVGFGVHLVKPVSFQMLEAAIGQVVPKRMRKAE
ncbi:MAG TPA: PAS domain S-box protein [Tepidisphaeraceae bacterium]|nr:PAS domain S-box protein [Tepidisphaeraceae bacterium]